MEGPRVPAFAGFATSALLFNALGRDNDVIEIDRAAAALPKVAAANRQVAVAGSVSTMRPVIAGSDRTSTQREWPESDARALFRRKVENLARCGVDLLMMEMMRDTDYSVWATEAAIATGLPVWVGISAEKNKDGVLTGFGREDMLLEDVARALAAVRPAVVSIMHTSPNDTDDAIAVVRKYWKGPLGAYPQSGYFRMPEWTFADVITPEELVDKARVWKGHRRPHPGPARGHGGGRDPRRGERAPAPRGLRPPGPSHGRRLGGPAPGTGG